MAKNDTKTLADMMQQVRGMFAANPMIAPQQEHFWKAQDRILDETEAYAKAWFARRHEAAQAALDVVHRINGDGGDASATLQAMTDWQQGSVKRLAEDMQQWIELCTTCAGRIAQAEVAAGREGADALARRSQSAAKAKHATPV